MPGEVPVESPFLRRDVPTPEGRDHMVGAGVNLISYDMLDLTLTAL